MLDIKIIREQPDFVKTELAKVDFPAAEPRVKRFVRPVYQLIQLFVPVNIFTGLTPETVWVINRFLKSLIVQIGHFFPPLCDF